MALELFDIEYGKLNRAQKEAVDTIEGPVMVVAGPGTGKTQVLALRIGNILRKTDTKADGILCLTFTNSGVKAMRERLRRYIGGEAGKINIATFHSFGMDMVQKYFSVLGLDEEPKLMDEKDAIALFDSILENNDWEHLRPRGDTPRYFRDLKSLISLLKRERITPEDFEKGIKNEIKTIENDEDNISSRGASKGELKKEIVKKIEGLTRTLEAVKFYKLYEEEKKKRNLYDYDDVLESLVKIVEGSNDAKAQIREDYTYILIDEHQDSSGVQNQFLEVVWSDVEKPNIFVVGDDRQLIYGFGGASLTYFENFKHAYGKAKLITLVENYRSTQGILDSSHNLLQSSLVEDKLKSNLKENHSLKLVEADYPRDEILRAGIQIKEMLNGKEGGVVDANEIAILVPKNRQVKSTVTILKDMGVPVASQSTLDLFDSEVAVSLLRVLKIIADPNKGDIIAQSFFDKLSGISPISAHEFFKNNNMKDFSLSNIQEEKNTLFTSDNEVNNWIKKLKSWLVRSGELNLYSLVQKVGAEFLLDTAKNHEELTLRIEVLRTILHLVLMQIEKPVRIHEGSGAGGDPKITLSEFLDFINRIEAYGESIPLASFAKDDGVKVLTLHGSKGLEFDFVWIAHMDERSFSSTKRGGFTLPDSISEKIEKKDEEVLKRELYVAITRAKRFCTISYALHSYTGRDQELAHIVANLEEDFEREDYKKTEDTILAHDPKIYIEQSKEKAKGINLNDLKNLVKRDYSDRKVSVSLLNNFFECPWKWYFRNLLQLPEPKGESLEFGNVVHASIDGVLKLNKTPDEDELKEIISKQVKKSNFGNDAKQKEFNRLAYGVVSRWVRERLGKISKNKENEQSISVVDDRFPHLNIYGKIDLIEHIDKDNVRVTDFKTGNSKKKNDIEKIDEDGRMSGYLRQLAMYSYLLHTNKKWNVSVAESCLEFVEAKNSTEMFYSTVIKDSEMDLLVQDIKDYDELLKTGAWVDRTCNFNNYGKSDAICEYCKMAEIYK